MEGRGGGGSRQKKSPVRMSTPALEWERRLNGITANKAAVIVAAIAICNN